MKVKAIKSFIGKISMNIDDEREIIDKKLAKDLIKAGHVIEIKADKKINKNENKEAEKEIEDTSENKQEETTDAVETTDEAE